VQLRKCTISSGCLLHDGHNLSWELLVTCGCVWSGSNPMDELFKDLLFIGCEVIYHDPYHSPCYVILHCCVPLVFLGHVFGVIDGSVGITYGLLNIPYDMAALYDEIQVGVWYVWVLGWGELRV